MSIRYHARTILHGMILVALAGKPTEKVIEEASNMYAFICKTLGVTLRADP